MRSFIVYIILLFSCSFLAAQEVIEVINIEKDEGLKDRTVDRVIRDDQGYFILFMLNTIQKYDGSDFENIEISAIKNVDAQVRDISRVDKLKDGTIIFHIPNRDFLFYLPAKGSAVKLAPLYGSPMVSNGELYVSKTSNLERLSHSTEVNSFRIFKSKFGDNILSEPISESELSFDPVSIAVVGDRYYLQDASENVYLLQQNQISQLDVSGKLIQSPNGVYVFASGSIYKIIGDRADKVTDLLERSYKCSILKLDQKGNIMAGYAGRPRFHDRVYVLDNNDVLHQMGGIEDVSDLFKDFYSDDAFYRWMLVGYNGLHVVSLARDGVRIIHKRKSTKKSEFGVVISAVATNETGEVIYSRESQGLLRYDKQRNSFDELLEEQLMQGEYENNAKMYYHKPSKAYYSSAYRYDGRSNVYKTNVDKEVMEKHVIPFKLNDIYVRNEDDLIIGGWRTETNIGTLATYNMKTRDLNIFHEEPNKIRSIYFDEITKTYWIGTFSGVVLYDKQLNKIGELEKSNAKQYKKSIGDVVMINRFNDKLILGTYGNGIYIVDPIEKKVEKQITEETGLTDNAAIGIMPDDEGYCWITTFNGVNIIDENFELFAKLYEHDGLSNREFNSKAIAKDIEGNIYCGTLNGVTMFEPSKVLKWSKSYRIDLSDILAYKGKLVERLKIEEEVPIYDSFDSLLIEYNIADYHKYPYVKELIDVNTDGLVFTLKEDVISLNKLKSGDFNIKLKPRGEGGEATVLITHRPNYRKVFIIFISILLISLLAFYISRSLISINNKREAEKTRLNKRISDMQLSSLQSQMNPHFIFNALGSVQYFIQTHDTEKADEYLSNFAMLMRSILESSKSKYMRLNEEVRLLELYVGLEKVRFEGLFEYEIKMDVNVDTEISIPPMIVQPFVENAINHGLYNLKNRKGKLLIHFKMPHEDLLKIVIEDNGVGRAAAARLRLKKHKSRGMQIVQERLDTLNLAGDINVQTETIDLVEDDIAKGTKIIISISSTY